MNVRREVRLAAVCACAWAVMAAHAADDARGCGAGDQPCAEESAPQATALVVPPAGDFATTRVQSVAYMPLDAGPSSRSGDTVGAVATRADSDELAMVDREIYALIGAALVAVLSLSRRRNL